MNCMGQREPGAVVACLGIADDHPIWQNIGQIGVEGGMEDRVRRMARREREHRERLEARENELVLKEAREREKRHAVASRKLELRWQGVSEEEIGIGDTPESEESSVTSLAQLDAHPSPAGTPKASVSMSYLKLLSDERVRMARKAEDEREAEVKARLEELYDGDADMCRVTRRNTNEEADARLLSMGLKAGAAELRSQSQPRVSGINRLLHLPDELWLQILSLLPRARDLQHCRATGHELHRIASDDVLWARLLRTQFPRWACSCLGHDQVRPLVAEFMDAAVEVPWNSVGVLQELEMEHLVGKGALCALRGISLSGHGSLLGVCRAGGAVALLRFSDDWETASQVAGHVVPPMSVVTVGISADVQTCMAVSQLGRFVVTGAADGRLRVCEMTSKRCVLEHQLGIGPLVGVGLLSGTEDIVAFSRTSACVVSLRDVESVTIASMSALCWAGSVAPAVVAVVSKSAVQLLQDCNVYHEFIPHEIQGPWEIVAAGGGFGLIALVLRAELQDVVLVYEVGDGDRSGPLGPPTLVLHTKISGQPIDELHLVQIQAGRLVFLAGMGQGGSLKTMRLNASGSKSTLETKSWTTHTWLAVEGRSRLVALVGGTLVIKCGTSRLMVVRSGRQVVDVHGCCKHGGRRVHSTENRTVPWEEIAAQFAPLAPWRAREQTD